MRLEYQVPEKFVFPWHEFAMEEIEPLQVTHAEVLYVTKERQKVIIPKRVKSQSKEFWPNWIEKSKQ